MVKEELFFFPLMCCFFELQPEIDARLSTPQPFYTHPPDEQAI
jgi:hypothetical protein